MELRSLCCIAAITLGLLTIPETAVSQSPSTEGAQWAAIETLKDKRLDVADWGYAGFDTPQSTMQTFMWALREREMDTIKRCFVDSEKIGEPSSDESGLEKARAAAKGCQALAIKRIDETTVDLKFKVQGWGESALVHRLKKTKAGWKLDTDSNTHDADW